jgi:hypothetical protein
MATITLLPVTAGTTKASDVNDVLYSSETASMRVINGRLEAANFAETLTSDHIREQSLVNGKVVAATGNLDCTAESYALTASDDLGPQAVPGASLEFYLPYAPSLVVFTWNVGAGNTKMCTGTEDLEFRFFIDGVDQVGARRKMPGDRVGTAVRTGVILPFQNFRYSGHHLEGAMTKGFHSASLRLFVGHGAVPGNLVRVRVRDMKVIWFR